MSTNPHADQERLHVEGRHRPQRTGHDRPSPRAATATSAYRDDPNQPVSPSGRREVVEREREQHGGIKIGSAFFGWLTATGTAVLLAGSAGRGRAPPSASAPERIRRDAASAARRATRRPLEQSEPWRCSSCSSSPTTAAAMSPAGWHASTVRSRGVAVWLWALVIAVLVAVLGAVAGSKFNVLANVDKLPRIPIGEGDLSTAGILAAIGVVVASLAGAILGGIAGMRFHRRVDRTGFGDD